MDLGTWGSVEDLGGVWGRGNSNQKVLNEKYLFSILQKGKNDALNRDLTLIFIHYKLDKCKDIWRSKSI